MSHNNSVPLDLVVDMIPILDFPPLKHSDIARKSLNSPWNHGFQWIQWGGAFVFATFDETGGSNPMIIKSNAIQC